MQRSAFGRTGLEVSILGFGGGPVGFLETAQHRVANILNVLLDDGVNLIDTAAMYLGSEEAIGQSVSHRRDEYVLVSKCGQAMADLAGKEWSADVITQTVDRSLRRLRTDHLDVMLLHSCELEVLKQGEAVGALIRARDAGKVRFVGYSGDNEAAGYAAELPDVAVIEMSVNICDQAHIDMVLPKTQHHNVGVIAKRPIANAAWKPLTDQRGIYADYVKTYSQRFATLGVEPSALGFDGDANRIWPEIALRFTLSQPGVHTAIIGTTDPTHAQANIVAASKGPLPAEAMEQLRTAFRRAESEAGETWIAQT